MGDPKSRGELMINVRFMHQQIALARTSNGVSNLRPTNYSWRICRQSAKSCKLESGQGQPTQSARTHTHTHTHTHAHTHTNTHTHKTHTKHTTQPAGQGGSIKSETENELPSCKFQLTEKEQNGKRNGTTGSITPPETLS